MSATYPSKAEHLDQAPAFLSITVTKGDSLVFLIRPVYVHEDTSNPGFPIVVPADLSTLAWDSDIIDANNTSMGKFTISPDSTLTGHVRASVASAFTSTLRVGTYRHWVKWVDGQGYEKTAYAGPFNVVERGHGVVR